MKEWYTTVEVAAMLGRSDRFVRDRIKEGKLSAVKAGGPKRLSYKISQEAVATFLMTEDHKNVNELSAMLQNVDTEYLLNLQEAVEGHLHKRKGMVILPHCGAMHKPAMALEAKRLAQEFVFESPAVYERYRNNPLNFTSTLINQLSGKAEAHFGIEVTTVEFFEDLCAGRAKDDYQPPWTRGHTPIFYVDVLIVEDPLWTPYIFRHLSKQLKAFCQKEKLDIRACFAVASAPEAETILQNYGFKEVASYDKKYPIMLCKDVQAGKLGGYLR